MTEQILCIISTEEQYWYQKGRSDRLTDGNTVPGKKCDKCGSGLVAVAMDVGYVECFCPNCELGIGWREPIDDKKIR